MDGWRNRLIDGRIGMDGVVGASRNILQLCFFLVSPIIPIIHPRVAEILSIK